MYLTEKSSLVRDDFKEYFNFKDFYDLIESLHYQSAENFRQAN